MGKKYAWEGNGGFGQAWQEDSWRHVDPHLEAMQKRAQSAGAEMLVVAVPFGPQFRTGLLAEDRDYVLWPQSRLKKICDQLGIPMLDLFAALQPEEDKGIFLDTVHFNERGHRVAAQAIAERIPAFPGAPKLSQQAARPLR
jgi:lysophospholipase L1-like esterase